jgi:hypothetical protein
MRSLWIIPPPLGSNGPHCIKFPWETRRFLLNLKLGALAFLVEEVVFLSLLKDATSLLLEGFDPFNQYSCMIYLSVGGLSQ